MGLQYDFKPNHLTDEGIQAALRRLEEKHGMSTAQFLTRYNRGLLGHAVEFIDWAGLAAVAQAVGAPGWRRVQLPEATAEGAEEQRPRPDQRGDWTTHWAPVPYGAQESQRTAAKFINSEGTEDG